MQGHGVRVYQEALQHNSVTSEHDISLSHMKALIEQYNTLTRGLWCYGIFFAEK
jgi:hypothetical protein